MALRRTAHLLRCFSVRRFHVSCRLSAPRRSIRPFLLADVGEGITECEVVKWSVKPLAPVQAFDPLLEVQSDKASVEITSPFDGIVKELLVKEGEIAKVGERLCLIEVEEEDTTAKIEAEPSPQREVPPPVPKPFPSSAPPQREEKRKHPLDPSNAHRAPSDDSHVLTTPSVRHFARQKGITDLSPLFPGSGRDGRLERQDIELFLTGTISQRPSHVSETPGTPGEDQVVELGRTRYAMWKSMTKSLEIPHFGYSTLLDLTALAALLPGMNDHIPSIYRPLPPSEHPPAVSPDYIYGQGAIEKPRSDPSTNYTKLTILPLLIKTLSRAMQEWPIFRSSITTRSSNERPSLTVRPHSDIAVAVSTPTGLYIPVLQAVDQKNPYEIMGELRRLQELGRRVPCGYTPTELPKRGATITVSNIGAIGKGEFAAPLLVPGGGVAIVALGRAKWVERDGQRRFEIGVSWSADHRVIEGAEMAAFVESWRTWVEQPGRLIGDGR